MPAVVAFWDRDRRNVLANRPYEELFGVTPASMRGRHSSEVFGAAYYAEIEPRIDAALAGEEQTFEQTLVTPAGQTRHLRVSYLPARRAGRGGRLLRAGLRRDARGAVAP